MGAADSVVAYDHGLGRITVVPPDGSPPRVMASRGLFEGAGSDPRVHGTLDDGRLVVSSIPRTFVERTQGMEEGDTVRWGHAVLLADPSRERVDTLGVWDGPLHGVFLVERPASGLPSEAFASPVARRVVPMAIAHWTLTVVAGQHTVVSRTDRHELHIFTDEGDLERVIRRTDVPSVHIDDEALGRLESASNLYTHTGWAPRAAPFSWAALGWRADRHPDLGRFVGHRLPTHSWLLSDDAGRIWVRDAGMPWEDERPDTWTVFDTDGGVIALAVIPADLELFHIGEEHVTGLERGERGVERVVVYELSIEGGGGSPP